MCKTWMRRGRWYICRTASRTLLLQSQVWVEIKDVFYKMRLTEANKMQMMKALVDLNFELREK